MQRQRIGSEVEITPEQWKQLSHRQRRCHVNRMRRKHRRMAAAQQRDAERKLLEIQPEYLEALSLEEKRLKEEERRLEARSMLENAAWLERERLAQEEFKRKREAEEKRKREKEERDRLIREEWEALKEKERAENEVKEREKREKEERLKEALSIGDKPAMPDNQAWRNPMAPDGYEVTPTDPASSSSSKDYGTEKDTQHCPFYLKTGACRFGERCSRSHPRLNSSRTLLIPSMFSILGLQQQMLNERDQDVGLEYDEADAYEDFKTFYRDTLPEFSKAGKVTQFKVSCNHEVHLRGNVYIQYSTEEECARAYQMFNGRWYAQKQLSCVFCPVTKWKSAICGLYNQKRCPKGKHCNFLHVFPDPTGAFFRADKDLPPRSPPPPRRSSSGHASSPTPGRRHFRHYRRSRSPQRSRQRSRSASRSRSRSRQTRRRHRRLRSRGSEVGVQRSRSASHSRSRSRESRRRRQRSESREGASRRGRRHSRSWSRPRGSPSHRRHRYRSLSHGTETSKSLSASRSESGSSVGSRDTRRGHKRKKKKKRGKRKKNREASPALSESSGGHGKHRHHKSKKHSHRHHYQNHHQDDDMVAQDKDGESQAVQDREGACGEVQDRSEKESVIQDKLKKMHNSTASVEVQDMPMEVQDRSEKESVVQDRSEKESVVQDKLEEMLNSSSGYANGSSGHS